MPGPFTDNARLYDIATRLQVYTEGVKEQYAREFNQVLYNLREELKKLLRRTKYKTLDGLTKAELNKLVISLRKSQSKVYSDYTEQVIKQLRDFMAASLQVNRRVFCTAYLQLVDENASTLSDEAAQKLIEEENKSNTFIPLFGVGSAAGADDRLWTAVMNSPIPANGVYLLPFLKGFSKSAQASVENLVRKAWANGWTVEETVNELAGQNSKQGTSNQMQRVGVQASAVLATAVQHVAAIVSAAVTSTLFGQYRWYSVIDSGTTDICRSRNQKVYRYGQGPIPPAHIRCRSHIAPIVGNSDDTENETFYTWLKRQPSIIQDDALGKVNAAKLRKGEIKAEDISKYETSTPLTLAEFLKKVATILSR